jgi:hypothetical protein
MSPPAHVCAAALAHALWPVARTALPPLSTLLERDLGHSSPGLLHWANASLKPSWRIIGLVVLVLCRVPCILPLI